MQYKIYLTQDNFYPLLAYTKVSINQIGRGFMDLFLLDKFFLNLFKITGEFFYADTLAGFCFWALLGAYAFSIAKGKKKC